MKSEVFSTEDSTSKSGNEDCSNSNSKGKLERRIVIATATAPITASSKWTFGQGSQLCLPPCVEQTATELNPQ